MSPIVHGLEAEFSPRVTFVEANARDAGAGQAAFDALGLRGHPGFVIFAPDGRERFRRVGVVLAEDLRAAIQDALRETTRGA